MQELVVAMMPVRLASYSPREQIGDGNNHAEVYQAIIKRSQEMLAKRGLYTGPADGQYSPAMGDAIRTFQQTAHLDATGIPDTATLWVLLNP
jgi:peptidoglycan hydrolase-like protein with peptidoglycan-binding domain